MGRSIRSAMHTVMECVHPSNGSLAVCFPVIRSRPQNAGQSMKSPSQDLHRDMVRSAVRRSFGFLVAAAAVSGPPLATHLPALRPALSDGLPGFPLAPPFSPGTPQTSWRSGFAPGFIDTMAASDCFASFIIVQISPSPPRPRPGSTGMRSGAKRPAWPSQVPCVDLRRAAGSWTPRSPTVLRLKTDGQCLPSTTEKVPALA